MSFRTFGVRVGVRVDDRSALPELLSRLPPACGPSRSRVADELFSVVWAPDPGGSRVRRYSLLYRGGDRLLRTLDRQEILDAFEGHLKVSVAERASRWVFLHAGVVAWGGGAIVIPGRSQSGKSRLVDALVRHGATYYSDEYAILDAGGRVHAYLAPLSLRPEGGGTRRLVAPPGPEGPRPPLAVRQVLLTRYRAGAAWRPRRLSPGRALLGLLDHAVPARRRPAEVIAALGRVVSGAPVLRGERGEADAVAARILGG